MKKVIIILLASALCSCIGGNKTKNSAEGSPPSFSLPQVPSVMQGADAANYLVDHYWDDFDFSDTAYIHSQNIIEPAFRGFAEAVNVVNIKEGREAVAKMISRARANMEVYDYFTEKSEYFFYDPLSPFRNDELYLPVLQDILEWDQVDELMKLRPQAQIKLVMQNRPMYKANNIDIELANGRKTTLYDINAEYLLLMINNPDCPACADMITGIRNSFLLEPLLSEGRLKVVAVYPDEDLAAWRNYVPKMPQDWINGFNYTGEMRISQTYDLKAIPTVYLLDANKHVLVKDADHVGLIERYLASRYY